MKLKTNKKAMILILIIVLLGVYVAYNKISKQTRITKKILNKVSAEQGADSRKTIEKGENILTDMAVLQIEAGIATLIKFSLTVTNNKPDTYYLVLYEINKQLKEVFPDYKTVVYLQKGLEASRQKCFKYLRSKKYKKTHKVPNPKLTHNRLNRLVGRRLKKVMKTYSSAERYSDNPLIYIGLGDAYLRMAQYKKALIEYQKALEYLKSKEYSATEWQRLKSYTYTRIGGLYISIFTGRTNNDSALLMYEKAIKVDSDYLSPYEGIYTLIYISKSVNVDTDFKKFYYRGRVRLRAKRFKELFGDCFEYYYFMGRYYSTEDKYDSALFFYKKAAAIPRGQRRYVYEQIEKMYRRLGQEDKAEEIAEELNRHNNRLFMNPIDTIMQMRIKLIQIKDDFEHRFGKNNESFKPINRVIYLFRDKRLD